MIDLIDDNVHSESGRKVPDPGVVGWFTRRPLSTLFLRVFTLSEFAGTPNTKDFAGLSAQLFNPWADKW